jgi:flavodoxin I
MVVFLCNGSSWQVFIVAAHPVDSPMLTCRIIYNTKYPTSETMTEVAVVVDSRGGNTRKIADAIAEELGVKAENVTTTLPDANVLFLGSGTYGGKPGEVMMNFIASGNLTGRKVALFGTSASLAGGQKMIVAMTDMVIQKGATILGSYHCKGRFLLVNWSHPDKEDLKNARQFARHMFNKNKRL